MIAIRIVWVLDVKKVVIELPGPFAKVGAPAADTCNTNPPEYISQKCISSYIFVLKNTV